MGEVKVTKRDRKESPIYSYELAQQKAREVLPQHYPMYDISVIQFLATYGGFIVLYNCDPKPGDTKGLKPCQRATFFVLHNQKNGKDFDVHMTSTMLV
jgi:hypothetical protein